MKNLIARLTISLFVFGTTLSLFGSQLDVQAFIDGKSDLVLQGNNVWWHHLDGAAPGRWSGNNATYLNGLPWFPDWPQPDENIDCNCDSSIFVLDSPRLGADGSPISLDIISARGSVTIVQQPAPNNAFTAIVEFDDNPSDGAVWYEVIISWTSVGPLPPSLSLPDNDVFYCGYGYVTVQVSDPDSDTLTVRAINCDRDKFISLGVEGCPWDGTCTECITTVTGTQGAWVDVTFYVTQQFSGIPTGVDIDFYVSDEQNTANVRASFYAILDFQPSIQCPADIIVQADPGQTSAIVNYPAPAASPGLCDSLYGVDTQPPAGSGFPIGTTPVVCTAYVQFGQFSPWYAYTAQCTFSVTVLPFDPCANDVQPPQISCAALKPSTFYGNPARIVGQFQLQASDDCDSDPLIYVGGTKTAFVAGPFHNCDIVEVAHGPSLTPGSHPSASPNVAAIQFIGDVEIWAVDSSGNTSAKQICR